MTRRVIPLVFGAVCLGPLDANAWFSVTTKTDSTYAQPLDPKRAAATAPVLLRDAPLALPDSIAQNDAPQSIILTLEIDATGRVIRVIHDDLPESVFVAAARAAAFQFQFSPATVDGRPIAARIRYQFVFDTPREPTVAPTPASSADTASPADASIPSDTETQETPDLPKATASQESNAAVPLLEVNAVDRNPRSAEDGAAAVHILRIEDAQRETNDTARMLGRNEGVAVQRSAGLGSRSQIALAGFQGEQIRTFFDGLPLELQGFSNGIAGVPLHLIGGIEIYKGVVPIQFGADALGGAIHLQSRPIRPGLHAIGSYEIGSFETHRANAGVTYRSRRNWFIRADTFFDDAQNNYEMELDAPNAKGQLERQRVSRFHDAYRAWGARAQLGRNTSRTRVALTTFVNHHEKELQNNLVMTMPYGDAKYDRQSAGGIGRIEHDFRQKLRAYAYAAGSYSKVHLDDTGRCIYDWFGHCVRENVQGGEIGVRPYDQIQRVLGVFGRAGLDADIGTGHLLQLNVSPSWNRSQGHDDVLSAPGQIDPLKSPKNLVSLVSGFAHTYTTSGERLQNSIFLKDYAQWSRGKEFVIGGEQIDRTRSSHAFGAGNAFSWHILPELQFKASYEWALRLPSSNEIFGDGVLVLPNLQLEPERSHNANLELRTKVRGRWLGEVEAHVGGFLRRADDLILLLGAQQDMSYKNMYRARTLGAEAKVVWSGPFRHVQLGVNGTSQRFENRSQEGAFAEYRGDRIPNQPYLFGNVLATLQWEDLWSSGDRIYLSSQARYVHEFFRGWESLGENSSKQVIPTQFTLSGAIGYSVETKTDPKKRLGIHVQIENLNDAEVYDLFGIPRPGRSIFTKLSVEL